MAIDYTYWNNGIKNNTFYPLGYNACDLFGVGQYRWPWRNCDSIKNNKVYTGSSTTNYSLFDSAAWKGLENSEYTMIIRDLNMDPPKDNFSVYLPYAKGEMILDKDDFTGSLKINAPLVDNFLLRDSSDDRNHLKSLTLNLKNANSIDLDGRVENETKISGTNLKVINFSGGDFNAIKINAPNLIWINFSGGTINGEMQMNINENCYINISGGTFNEGIFSGMPLTNTQISHGFFDVVNPDPAELQKLDELDSYQFSWFIGYAGCSQWALKTYLDSLKVAFPNGGREIIIGFFMDTEGEWIDGSGTNSPEWLDIKAQYSAAGFTLMTQEEYFNMPIALSES